MIVAHDRIALPAGAVLFREGDAGDAASLIASGRIDIWASREASETLIASNGPGELVGEFAILDSGRRSATARAAEDCELVVVTGAQIDHRLKQTDPILRMCIEVVIARCREMIRGVAPREKKATPSAAAALGMLSLESDIRRGVASQEFCLFYQPIVALGQRRVAGFEGLMRWRHPSKGLVAPVGFIPAAEAGGLITDLTVAALSEATIAFPLLTAAALLQRDAILPFLTINVSCDDLEHPEFGDRIKAFSETMGAQTHRIKLEVTESALMRDPDQAAAALEACRALGLGVAIDDFGAGYSSLAYLATLPITTLKVDASFVRSMEASASSRKIVQTILRLADELQIPVVAEGVETEAQAAMLESMGCAFAQGYLFGRPASLEEAVRRTGEAAVSWEPVEKRA